MSLLTDTALIAGRNARAAKRIPEVVFFALMQPVMFVVLFRYVFGGAIDTGSTSYVNFLMGGIFVQTACFAAFGTATGLAEDMARGLLDRFRSLPMVASSVITGRIVTDMAVQLVAQLVMFGVGLLVGFRPVWNVANLVLTVVLLLSIIFAFAWLGASIGLSMRSVQAVQTGGMFWLFPLTFVSSAFVPVATMPTWLQGFATNQPITRFVDAVRSLILNSPDRLHDLAIALGWCAAIVVVFTPLALRAFRRAAIR